MTQERWRKLEALFHEALRHGPETRTAFLDDTCGSDPEMRRHIESLLANEHEAGSFLENAALDDLEDILSPRESPVGRQLGPYRVLSEIGAGGMGEVYRARDVALDREVAIKTLPYEIAHNPEPLSRFRREARTLASVNHPNIGAIYQLYESEETSFLVLELVEGEMLRGPLPIAIALDRARQVAQALEAAHARGIIHRDLKPANVKVTPQGTVKVLDFGLAKAIGWRDGNKDLSETATALSGATLSGHVVGTPGYMSPEQARGKEVDHRTDIWAFGCLLYELLAGKRAFAGETLADTIASVLEREPDWKALPAKTPDRIRELLRKCLQKDPAHRLANISDARRTIEQTQRGRNLWAIAAAAIALIALLSAAGAFWTRSTRSQSDRADWVQLTRFPDSVTQPALSPDGRTVAFIRGPSTFAGPGQIYVKALPDGEPVQLTHDNISKMGPVFSPDGARIAYTTYMDQGFSWDTWVVPAGGGEPRKWLKNASGLVWTGPHELMFSEIRMGVHMGVVTSDERRTAPRSVYMPAAEPGMAHRSSLSPDRKWAVLVEMDQDHLWEPCRVVPADGSSPGRKVGPPEGGCTFAAWSPDGKWIYLTSNAVGTNHIWRQSFPDGRPEQITSGPTEEEGIAMEPDGRSFITAVALKTASLWVHDSRGDREIALEGNPSDPKFTPDGKKLLYRLVREPPSEFAFYRDLGEVRVTDLESGRSEPLVRGFEALNYEISPDGRGVALETADREGKPRLWLAPLDQSAPPKQVANVEGVQPRFGQGSEIFFRRTEASRAEGTTGFVYRVRTDGSGMQRIINQPVLALATVSPDGRWLVAWAPLSGNGPPYFQAFPADGGPPVVIGSAIHIRWSPGGRFLSIASSFGAPIREGRSYVVPLPPGRMLPRIPAGGFHSEQEVASLPGARRIDLAATITDVTGPVIPGPSPDVYAYYRGNTQRNLYRIPIP